MLRRWWWVLPLVLVAAVAMAIVWWASTSAEPMPEALAALESGGGVVVETEPWLIFRPEGIEPGTGFIFYPGGHVQPEAYAPPARALAEAGYLAVIVPMPLDLAVLGAGRAADVIAAYPEVEKWAIGGHSLGGSMAANFASRNPGQVDGLVLWAAYPAGSDDLSSLDLAVVSIYGTLDGLATPPEVTGAAPLLPAGTGWVEIEGGNHAQFGWYGPQDGDNPATIDRLTQQAQAIDATLELLAAP